MAPKPQLSPDVSKANCTPPVNHRSSRHYKNHTNYVDLVSRPVGDSIGAKKPKRRRKKSQRLEPEVTAESYKNCFGEDMSSSLGGSMGGYASARLTQAREEQEELQENLRGGEEQPKALRENAGDELLATAKYGSLDKLSEIEKPRSYQKPAFERYRYPREIYTKDRSDKEYLALFSSFEKLQTKQDHDKGSR
ncbi:hypothetical protein EJ07DRAFT_173376 [Lizonia empirigonia]|nr:hypothetical protein EJ07DRAFT_173376 [Lizonia empirigonia]